MYIVAIKAVLNMRHVIFLFFIIFLLACGKPAQRNNEITKVELARSGAWSDFGASISVDTSLNYKYFGDYENVKQGYFIGKVNRKFWDTLNQKLERIKFKTLPVSDNVSATDINYFELIIHWKNGKRRLLRAWNGRSDSVLNVIKWLDTSYKNMELHQIKDTIRFETTYHNLPKPPIRQVKFPPPIKKYR
jgi:hypothetical protein